LVSSRQEDAVGHAGVEMHVVVERRAETVQEGDAAEPRAGSIRRLGIMWDTGGREQGSLDLGQKDLREGRDGSGPIGEHAAQSLGHGNHPLPHGHRRDDVIGEVGGGLGHVAAVAGRADAAALSGECHDESRVARHADRAGEPKAEEPAFAIAAGIGWGIRGAVEQIVAEAQRPFAGAAQVLLTGGSEAATKRIAIGSRVRRDGNYGDQARFWAVAPEHAIGARGSVLGVGFEDLVLRIERVREGVVLVRVQAWVTGILTEQ
jgi:hypothetical protein